MKSVVVDGIEYEIAREAAHIMDSKQCETCEKHYKDGSLACNNVVLREGKFYETECPKGPYPAEPIEGG